MMIQQWQSKGDALLHGRRRIPGAPGGQGPAGRQRAQRRLKVYRWGEEFRGREQVIGPQRRRPSVGAPADFPHTRFFLSFSVASPSVGTGRAGL